MENNPNTVYHIPVTEVLSNEEAIKVVEASLTTKQDMGGLALLESATKVDLVGDREDGGGLIDPETGEVLLPLLGQADKAHEDDFSLAA